MTALETRLRATLTFVAESAPVPPLPPFVLGDDEALPALNELLEHHDEVDAPSGRGPRRRVLAVVAALALVGGGLSIAAASGLSVLPTSLTSALGWSPDPGAINAYSQTTRQLFTEPGPDGTTLHLYYADATDDSYCVALSTAVDGNADQPRGDFGGACGGTIGDRYWNTFGGQSSGGSGPDSPTTFIVRAAGAATVRLQFDDGTSRALPIADGFTAGWFSVREKALHPVLVGFATDGTEVGRFTNFG